MTRKYYTERLLPVYVKALDNMSEMGPLNTDKYMLQVDEDSSHGKRKHGLAQQLRDQHNIKSITHPAQSPDLNPQEACWDILKQRIRRCTWRTIEELKRLLQEEWDKIMIDEVRARIAEMPGRCNKLVIKSDLW